MRIKTKILTLTITTLTLIIFVFAHYSQRIAEKDHEIVLKEDAAKIVRQIGSYVPPDGKVTDRTALEEDFKELLFLSSHLVRIDTFIVGREGALKPFFSMERYKLERTPIAESEIGLVRSGQMILNFEEKPDGNYVNVIAPLRSGDRIYGVTELKISHDEFYGLIANRKKATLLVTVIAVLVIAGVLVFSMDHMVSRPIQMLLSAISQVKGGNLDVRVDPGAGDEIGSLTEHFNGMVETINRNTLEKETLLAQINRHNDELQQKIRLATDELLKRNEALRVANQSIYNIQKKLGHSRRLAAVGQLAATVAHELGTPLHSVSGHLQLLMEEQDLSKDMTRRLTIMQSQLERITDSIQNLLNTTRQPEANFDMLDLNRMLGDLLFLVMPETLSRHIMVDQDFQTGLPHVFGSSGRIQEVFLNLIDNAIDASYDGGTISVSTRVVDIPPGEDPGGGKWVKVAVTDNGRGIPKEYIGKIFAPFYTTKVHGRGTGLGLSISQEIVRSHHGHIEVKSRPGEGSAFMVFLPAAEKKG